MLPRLLQATGALPRFHSFVEQLPPPGRRLTVGGVPGASAAVVVATVVERLPQRTVVVVGDGPGGAERWLADLRVLLGDLVRLYPQREALGGEEPHREIAGERVETVEAVLRGAVRVLVTTVRATAERTGMPAVVRGARLELGVGDRRRPTDIAARLDTMGYERRATVLDVGQFAVRGGIIDIYGFGMAAPTRVEWWGDEVISVRAFDLDTQRSEGERETVAVLPVSSALPDAAPASPPAREALLDLLPPDTVVVLDAAEPRVEVDRMWHDAEHHLAVARRMGESVPPKSDLFLAPDAWAAQLDRFGCVAVGDGPGEMDFRFQVPEPVNRDMRRLQALVRTGPTLVLCDNEGQLERLEELLAADDLGDRLPPTVTLAIGALHAGFVMPGLTVLTDHEIFRRARRLRRARRYRQATVSAVGGALSPGDFVVHLDHGIGQYRGTETLTTEAGTIEVAVLGYEGGDRLNVPLYRLDQLERYRAPAPGDAPPKLHRLGGGTWRRQRTKTEAAIRTMAAEMVELYARRSLATGYAYAPDTKWQTELESAFLYEDTPDQRLATERVKRAMEQPAPMDMVVVGDVGYGKTEIAIRAAFKAAVSGRQVAVLVPTTILAEQHARTFGERVADFPVSIDVLSRFRRPAEQREVLRRLAEGKLDIVIGTHRLLSKDVQFHDLGLLIVDEEHRFGVRHKERLKALRLEVDVLMLTATPIPRTLQMALSGLRDLVPIQTPPRDRSPVLTFVEPWDDELLEEAMARELDRGGQVYFVHNRIETIETIAERVRRLAPRARVAVGHGQTREAELDRTMRAFVAGEVDVLVSTMIVESGLDVANANTMIVHHAEQFGLAQLYQLRGRVGRGHRRAYCYLVAPEALDPDAEHRLKLLEHHTELGAGYALAMRDLEFRGAGNFLGLEQSGHAHAVGFDLYMRLLGETVRALKGDGPAEGAPPPEVVLDGPAHFPDGYIPDDDAKLDFYRRLARTAALDDLGALRVELRDRFGPLPEEAERLMVVFDLRILGSALGVQTVTVRGDEARVRFRLDATPRMARLNVALDEVQLAVDVRQMHPLTLRLHRLGGSTMTAGLIRALTSLCEADTTTAGATRA